MTPRPKPPETYDESPPLDPDFFAHARPAMPGDAARLRAALKRIVEAHEQGRSLEETLANARQVLSVAG